MTILTRMVRLLLVTAAFALSLGSAGSQETAKPHSISGQVFNSVSGEPIARARVQVGSQQAALTDRDGRFEFDNVSEDSAWASAFKPGYFAEDRGVIAQGRPVALRLTPEAILFGTITDQNGQPIQDLNVQLSRLEVHNGLRRWQMAKSTSTSVEGKYRFAELEAGQYSLATGFRIEGLADAEASVAFVPVSFPPRSGDEIHGALALKPGDQVEANASPAVEKLFAVSGTVNGMVGQGVGFVVETRDGDSIDPPIHIYPGGGFGLRLPSGSYRFQLSSAVESDRKLIATREVSVAEAPLQGISITLEPQAILPIEVEYQAGNTTAQNSPSAPPPYLNVSLEDNDPQSPLRSIPAQPVRLPSRGQAPVLDSPLAFRDVPPGRYALRSQPPPPWYVASAACGGVDLTRDPLVIAAGAAACTVQMVLRDDAASLKWTVTPVETGYENHQVFVIAIPLDNIDQTASEVSALPDQSSSRDLPVQGALEGLAPGRYLVMALPHHQELAYHDSQVMQQYLSLGQEVTLSRGGTSEVQLQMVRGPL